MVCDGAVADLSDHQDILLCQFKSSDVPVDDHGSCREYESIAKTEMPQSAWRSGQLKREYIIEISNVLFPARMVCTFFE